jgi:hypothetical protein
MNHLPYFKNLQSRAGLALALASLCAAGMAACGGSEPEPPAPVPAPPTAEAPVEPAAPPEAEPPVPSETEAPDPPEPPVEPSPEIEEPAVSGDFTGIRGVARFDGERPRRRIIRMSADPGCEAIHGDNRVGSEEAIVRPDGAIKNVFVYAKSGAALGAPAPTAAAKLDQVGCMYAPHVLGVQVNQPIDIVNSDNVAHNVHAQPKINQGFNFGQPGPGIRQQTFRRAEMAIPVKCDIHPWMLSYVFVMEHPFFALSADDGSFSIPNLPAGEHTLVAWHETFGERELSVTVPPGGGAIANFTFAP